jgi:3-hydroxybutyrate dehydrogenase
MTMLRGRAALVTGSTSGIGEAIAEALAAAGADVMLNGLGEAKAIERQQAGLATAHGVRVLYNGADLSRGAEVEALVRDTQERLGGLDILVNNAGIQHVSPVEDFPPEQWDRILAINLSSNFHAIRAAVPQMRQRKWGRIINIASAHGLVASINKTAYIAAKHGVVGLTKAVALETAAAGITCNAICPGWVLTPLVERQIHDRAREQKLSYEEMRARWTERTPSQGFVEPAQIGGLAVFLCSPAADQITGAPLSIDGGWVAQ